MEESAARLLKTFLSFRRLNWNDVFLEKLNFSQIGVLLTLVEYSKKNQNSNIIMSELSKRCNLTRPALTQIINSLEEEELVERFSNSKNRRIVFVRVTSKGEEVAKLEKRRIISFFNKIVSELGFEETEHLINLLDKLYLILNNDLERSKLC